MRRGRGPPGLYCTVLYSTLHCTVLYCTVFCTVYPRPVFTWTREDGGVISGEQGPVLRLRRVDRSHEGVYTCRYCTVLYCTVLYCIL